MSSQHIRRVLEWCEVAKDVHTLCASGVAYDEPNLIDLLKMADHFWTLTVEAAKNDLSGNYSQFTQFIFQLINFWKTKMDFFVGKQNITPSIRFQNFPNQKFPAHFLPASERIPLSAMEPFPAPLPSMNLSMMLDESLRDVSLPVSDSSSIIDRFIGGSGAGKGSIVSSLQAMNSLSGSFVPGMNNTLPGVLPSSNLTLASSFFVPNPHLQAQMIVTAPLTQMPLQNELSVLISVPTIPMTVAEPRKVSISPTSPPQLLPTVRPHLPLPTSSIQSTQSSFQCATSTSSSRQPDTKPPLPPSMPLCNPGSITSVRPARSPPIEFVPDNFKCYESF